MDSITYTDVARRIAAAETEQDRREAGLVLAFYYRFGRRQEPVRGRIAALRHALQQWSDGKLTDVG